ncbi:protocatechuate 3,4-dioxygenase subunit alpha [Dictyobacter kobayashii]|uniref:Protocatechuate 3,4-dioxygenase subunit alpha n=1 Tax=Dictyobacter kobayashii TaxID=2014872 RepID=A0A402ACI1_9CHLR|nr:protocatechuate 3,4-dioxygenase subunit alpha [Dictyobacter kobayashii]GCE16804.1 protocatechuate 3,4-dioxygenase subunit alpha [Dictyobacter kobayashii]
MNVLPLTASQTVGPFFSPALLREDCRRNILTSPQTVGARIRIEGIVVDGDGLPVPDALVEIWQANAHGRYNHPSDQGSAPLDPSFSGFGRSGTDENGAYWFETVKPGGVSFDEQQLQAPHICITVFARGLLNHLVTRLYFEDEPANASDPVLLLVPEQRRLTLLARCELIGEMLVYRFDIILQGAHETAFFNL